MRGDSSEALEGGLGRVRDTTTENTSKVYIYICKFKHAHIIHVHEYLYLYEYIYDYSCTYTYVCIQESNASEQPFKLYTNT
jgi:hypothetical protein